MIKKTLQIFLVITSFALSSCGGGGGGGSTEAANPTGFGAVVVSAKVKGATCYAYKIENNTKVLPGTQADSTSSDSGFVYFSTTNSGNMVIECSGGSYTDEATGLTNTPLTGTLTSVASVITGNNYAVTPLTELAFVRGNSNLANVSKIINTYNKEVATQYGLGSASIVDILPSDLETKNSIDSSDSSDKYAIVLAAISEIVGTNTSIASSTLATTSTANINTLLDNALSSLATKDTSSGVVAGLISSGDVSSIKNDIIAVPVSTITISASPSSTINIGDKTLIIASTNTDATNSQITYKSNDLNVVSIDTYTGIVSAIGHGTTTIVATAVDDTSKSATIVITIKSPQSSFNAGSDVNKTFGDANFTQNPTGVSSTATTTYFSDDTSVVNVNSSGEITIVSVGSATITITSPSDNNYLSASDSYIVNVAKANQSSFNAGSDVNKTFGDANFTQNPTGVSSTATTTYFSDDTSVVNVNSSGEITIVSAGSATITITSPSDNNYLSASDSYIVNVAKANQSSFNAGSDINKTFGDANFTQNPTGVSSTATTTYFSDDISVVNVNSSGEITIVSVGSATITITSPSDNNYLSASDSYIVNVAKASQSSISISDITKSISDANFTPIVSGGSGDGNVIATLSSKHSVATIENNQVKIINPGTATITAYKLGNNNYNDSNTTTFLLTVGTQDPLYQYQWHIKNTGQSAFATNGGTADVDINYGSTTENGKGIIVAVVDTGLEIAHEDLVDNVVVGGSKDFKNDDSDPTNPTTTGDHGTSVAGIISATGYNGIGGRGIAYRSSLKGFNFLESDQDEGSTINSLGGASYSADVDIFNQSFGSGVVDDYTINTNIEAQYKYGVENLRSGKGAIYVKSSGNGFKDYKYAVDINTTANAYCTYANDENISCQNANMDATNTLPYNIVVGALNAKGKKSSYSTTGSALWVAGFGGEYGTTDPALITTDQSSCSQGYVRSSASSSSAFSNGSNPHSENPSCNYVSTFNGTSSAAPVVSGVIALMLEANPNLTWRDVKHILATTAVQVDSSISPVSIDVDGTAYEAEMAWTTNNAGHKFHNYYGFGGVDTTSAISSAKYYVAGSLGSFTTTNWENSGTLDLEFLGEDATGISHSISSSSNLTIEAVQIKINVTHDYLGELAIELTSPSGTRSILFNTVSGFDDSEDLTNMVLLSNAFYGENSSGNWTIKVLNAQEGSDGVLNNWSIRIFGH
jgi:subtilisin family serine protease